MNGTNHRRGFLKGFGLLSAIAAGAATHHLANTGTSMAVRDSVDPVLQPPVDISHLAPLGKVNLTLTADNEPPPVVKPVSVQYTQGDSNVGMQFMPKGAGPSVYTMSGSSHTQTMMSIGSGGGVPNKNNVKMSVGRDNRLWIEIDGQWRRVALEG